MGRCRWPVVPAEASCNPPLSMGDALAASTGRSGGARGRFPGAARAQAAPLHEPERCGPGRVRQALDAGQVLDVAARLDVQPGRRLPDRSSPRADLDAFARRSTWARRSTCGAARRATWTALPDLSSPRMTCNTLQPWMGRCLAL